MKCGSCGNENIIYNCSICSNPLCVKCESKLGGSSICPGCRARLRERKAAQYEAKTRNLNCPCGLLAGILAAVASAVAWSQVALLTGGPFEVGGIVLGGMVGYGVMKGAGDKRGYILQQMAAAIAIAGIILAYFLVLLRTQRQAYSGLVGSDSSLIGALCAFPGYLSDLGLPAWLFLVLGTLLAYYIPAVRAQPEG